MKKKKQALIFLAVAVLLIAVIAIFRPSIFQPEGSQNPSATASQSSLDVWTAAPEEETPVPAPSSASEQTSVLTDVPTDAPKPGPTESPVTEDGIYDSKEEVALFLHLFGHLPSNYITKKSAQDLGWPGGSLEEYAPGKCIGGDRFGNYEKLLPVKKGRAYFECDIDTLGARSRGSKRIVWSSDGLIYYTGDHYESFTLLYGEE